MADNVTVDNGTGTDYTVASDDDGTSQHQYVKVEWGPDNTQTKVNTGASALPIQDGGNSITVDDGASTLSVDDGGGSLTVDGTVAVSGTVTVNASGNAVPVTDNSGSLTVDNGGTFAVQDSEKVADNAAFTDGTTKVNPAGFVYDEVAGTALTENDVAAARIDSKRALTVTVEDGTTRGQRLAIGSAGAVSANVSAVGGFTSGVVGTGNVGSGTQRVVLATDQPQLTNALKVDGSAVTQPVSGTVGVSGTVTVDSELTTSDLDTGAGTDTRAVVGLVGSKSGGGALIPGDATAGLKVDLGTDNDVTVTSGTITTITNVVHVDDNASTLSVDDGGGSLTVDGTVAVSGTVTVGSHAVTNAGTFAVQDSEKVADNAAFTDGTTKVQPVGYIYDEVAGTALTENDIAAARINVNRSQVFSLEDGSTRGRYANVTASSALKVDNSGVTQPVSGTITASNTAGDIAHDSADSGNPVKVGAKAANALPTAVANGDRTNNISDLWGRQLTAHIDPAMQVSKVVNVTTTQTGSDVWSPTSGKKIAVTYLSVAAYGATNARVILWFGDNADTTYTAGTDQVLWAGSFAPSSTAKPGMVISFPVPIFCTTADRELHLTTDGNISLDITVYGYEW